MTDGPRTWYIHLFKCPDCGATAHADRNLPCRTCRTTMKQQRRVGVVCVE